MEHDLGRALQSQEGSASSLRLLRQQNHRQVVAALATLGETSRAELARRTGLSRSTISVIVGEMLERGLVVERLSEAAGQVGRPPVLVALQPEAAYAVGIAFDHQDVRVAVADLSRTVVAERTAPFDVDRDARGAIDLAARLVDEALGGAGVARTRVLGAGIALAAPVDPGTGAPHPSSGVLRGWRDVDLRPELGARLGTGVLVDNEANLGALAEVTCGAAIDGRHVAYVSIASGIGAGLVLHGRPYRGHRGLAGEFGHVVVDPDGSLCRCGSRGCLETVATGGALTDVLRESRGIEATTAELVRLALDGDVGCRRLIADAGRAVGVALASLVSIVGPDTIVIGGELGAAGDVLLQPVRDAIRRYAPPAATEHLRVVPAALGARAGVLGAVALVLEESDEAVVSALGKAARSSTAGPFIPTGGVQ